MFAIQLFLVNALLLVLTAAETPKWTQVSLALRSDCIALAQLTGVKDINYTVIHQADQDYCDFMTLMRHEQSNLRYLHEHGLFEQFEHPLYGKTSHASEPPITDLYYTNILARNMRFVVAQAMKQLGSDVKCDCIVTPHSGVNHDYAMLVRYASELAGCGSIGYSQVKFLEHAILYGYDLDMVDGTRWQSHPEKYTHRMTILVEVEPSHTRITTIDLMRTYPIAYCVQTCDKRDASLSTALQECLTKFEEQCLGHGVAHDEYSAVRKSPKE